MWIPGILNKIYHRFKNFSFNSNPKWYLIFKTSNNFLHLIPSKYQWWINNYNNHKIRNLNNRLFLEIKLLHKWVQIHNQIWLKRNFQSKIAINKAILFKAVKNLLNPSKFLNILSFKNLILRTKKVNKVLLRTLIMKTLNTTLLRTIINSNKINLDKIFQIPMLVLINNYRNQLPNFNLNQKL